MRSIVLISFLIMTGCILTAGCIGQIKNTTVNATATVTPKITFSPFSNASNVTNVTNATVTTGFQGPLRVSIGGWQADLPVFIDNTSVGIVTHDKPLDLMLDEGNHTVKICAGKCKEEIVSIQFARPRFVDFEEWLLEEVKYAKPTAQMVGYYTSGDEITITIEFINPLSEDVTMSAEVRCGYSYIESRSNNRVGGVAQGIINTNVEGGTSKIQTVDLGLASGSSYVYDIPTISKVTIR
jgi:hypothetical protein